MTRGRRDCRQGQACEPRTLAEAIYCAVHHSTLDARAIAERLGVRYTYLTDAANPDREDLQFQARLFVPLVLVTGNYGLVQFLARALGGVFVALPSVEAGAREIFETGHIAVREFAEALDTWGASLADGTVSEDEITRVRAQAHDAIAAISAMVQLAESRRASTPARPQPFPLSRGGGQ